jgi:hypothetical protein
MGPSNSGQPGSNLTCAFQSHKSAKVFSTQHGNAQWDIATWETCTAEQGSMGFLISKIYRPELGPIGYCPTGDVQRRQAAEVLDNGRCTRQG